MIDTRGNHFGAGHHSPKRVVEARDALAVPGYFALPTRGRDAISRRGEYTRSRGLTADAAPILSPSLHRNHRHYLQQI